jgi:hypothetical protein
MDPGSSPAGIISPSRCPSAGAAASPGRPAPRRPGCRRAGRGGSSGRSRGWRGCRAGGKVGSASVLKASFAAFQKAARTLAGVSHALADAHGVADILAAEAKAMPAEILSDPDYLPSVAARAWRWAPEMQEVADTLREAGLPAEIAEATASVMARWEKDKDQYELPLLTCSLTCGKALVAADRQGCGARVAATPRAGGSGRVASRSRRLHPGGAGRGPRGDGCG